MAADRRGTGYDSRTYDAGLAPLLVVAPTQREIGGLVGDRQDGFRTAITGIGHRAGPALAQAVAGHPPGAILSLGFAGALAPHLKPGQIIVHDVIVATGGDPPLHADPSVIDAAMNALREASIPALRGTLLTAPAPILTGASKTDAGGKTGAVAVDMEGYDLARTAAGAGSTILSVRAILDEAERDLPSFVAGIITDGGRREWVHTLRAMKDPLALRSLIPLALRARTASAALRRAASVLVRALNAPLRPRA